MNILIISALVGLFLTVCAWVWALVENYHGWKSPLPDILGGLGALCWAWPVTWVILSLGAA